MAPTDVSVMTLKVNIMQQSHFSSSTTTKLSMTDSNNETPTSASDDPSEIIGRRIMVTGDVNGGYVRTCINNEAGRFRRLLGAMSPPDDSNNAEIYVEGKRKQVDAFLRWCKRGRKSVGLSQNLEVLEIIEEDPTGLYDGFYVKTK
eukprot:CAMPEP_0197827454 /NCGR_PEP_ID=MMETSP1437-20131217/4218_1 /TAXON_ID=49252 ORGANISM="Eucampia antarctica, Strain CCMP1452" /NCGR_SAMPLE_ID=MMETSP1437 /ASSEMBLY_ACC=CAM_ASM_001096 /LENGTH=145 /DNA_ID=CAMNT_0043428287 /DNA_START=178 /DNA_END=615 /DNA_ORIENTATION=-